MYKLTDSVVGRFLIQDRITYETIETLNLNTSVGGASVYIYDTADAVNTTITTQNSQDSILVVATGADTNLVINTAGGADVVNVQDTGIDGSDAERLRQLHPG